MQNPHRQILQQISPKILNNDPISPQQPNLQCFLLRHAESKFNQVARMYDHTLQTQKLQKSKIEYYFDTALIDCPITQNGVKQIQGLNFPYPFSSHQIFFDIIFVSPMSRALQTAQHVIRKHKIQYKKVIVLAGLTQVMKNICDFGNQLGIKKQKYKDFDFSNIQQQEKERSSYWQDEFIDQQYRLQIDKTKQNGERYVNILKKVYPKSLESPQRCVERTKRVIKQMKQICMKQKSQRILVVTHNRILKNILTGGHQQKLAKFKIMDNCQIRKSKI